MDLLKMLLLYMTLTVTASAQSTVLPVITPPPATPPPYYTQAPTSTPVPTASPVPKPTITPSMAYTQLEEGDYGDDVRKMQQRLFDLGYYTGKIDGVYGAQTAGAVERFQYNNGLYRDGIAGKRTLTILYESPDVVPAAVPATPTPSANVTPTPQSSESPAPVITAAPSITQAPVTLIPSDSGYHLVEDSEIFLNKDDQPLMDENGNVMHLLGAEDDTVLIPLEAILRTLGYESEKGEKDTRSWSIDGSTITVTINPLLYSSDTPLLILSGESVEELTDRNTAKFFVDTSGNAYVYSPLLDTFFNTSYETVNGMLLLTLNIPNERQ